MAHLLRRIQDRLFYKHNPRAPNLPELEQDIQELLPELEDVTSGDAEPMRTKKLKTMAEDRLDKIKGSTAVKKLYELEKKGVAMKIAKSQWVSLGRMKRELDPEKLRNFFIFVGLIFLFGWPFIGIDWVAYLGIVLIGMSVIFW